MADKIFPKGIRSFAKHEKAPDFVLGAVIINPNELFSWLKENPEYLTEYKGQKQIRFQLTLTKDGRPSLSVDTYGIEPKADNSIKPVEDDLPF